MKIEIYYNKKNDSVQLVKNDVLTNYDECISSCEFLNYFGDNVNSVGDLKQLSKNDILEGYNTLESDFKSYANEKEINEYYKNVKNKKIEGELILKFN